VVGFLDDESEVWDDYFDYDSEIVAYKDADGREHYLSELDDPPRLPRREYLAEAAHAVKPIRRERLRKNRWLGPRDLDAVGKVLGCDAKHLSSPGPTVGGYAWDVAAKITTFSRQESFEWLAELLGFEGAE